MLFPPSSLQGQLFYRFSVLCFCWVWLWCLSFRGRAWPRQHQLYRREATTALLHKQSRVLATFIRNNCRSLQSKGTLFVSKFQRMNMRKALKIANIIFVEDCFWAKAINHFLSVTYVRNYLLYGSLPKIGRSFIWGKVFLILSFLQWKTWRKSGQRVVGILSQVYFVSLNGLHILAFTIINKLMCKSGLDW